MFVDGGHSKTYDVDISIIYDFHSTPSTNVHRYIKFRRFLSISAESPLLSPVSCLLSLVSCLPSSVSHAVSAADLIYNNIADLAILWSKFVDLGNLAILTLLADLAD